MLSALFPGSFDPPTSGHLNVITRCAKIFSHLYVVVADNGSKSYSMPAETRYRLMERLAADLDNVSVHIWERLIVDFAARKKVTVIVRGVRAMEDFEYEFQLSMMNRGLNEEVETLLIPTDPSYFVLRSSAIKELIRLGGDISSMVPTSIIDEVLQHYGGKKATNNSY